MKNQYVKELAEGTRVDTICVLAAREMRSTRTGDAYLAFEISDKTGRIQAVFFRPSARAVALQSGSVVRVSGVVTVFRGSKRVSVDKVEAARTYDPGDLVASGHRDTDELVDEFKGLAAKVRSAFLRAILKVIFGDAEFFERFSTCPGAQSHHHAYRGGLIEHTVSVARLCRQIGETYDEVDADMLLAAALLHDIGKVDEIEHSVTIEYTNEGRLIGHVVLGERRIVDAAASCGVRADPTVLVRLCHAVLSHHGELEWGSPKRPSTLEALVLHHADNLDAKAAGFIEIMNGVSALDERWTDAQNLFRRPLFAPMSAEDERLAPVREDDQYDRCSA